MRMMRINVNPFFVFTVFLGIALSTSAVAEKHEREASHTPPRVTADWMISPVDQQAVVHPGINDKEIVLSNGLISRTFRIAPNAATVGFDNLMTGEAMLRGVKPEAMIRLRGMDCAVGGLTGQPNYAFLRPEWVDGLGTDPLALRFDSYEVSETKERFPWKRVRHAADLPWPPPGVALTLNFKATPGLAQRLAAQQSEHSEIGRTTLISDDFQQLSDEWKVHVSPHERATFSLEGRHGAVVAPANTTVYAERKLPAGVRIVQCTVNAGTDDSNDWGPGIALVWPERTVKFYIRSNQKRIGIYDGTQTLMLDAMDTGVTHHLRMRLAADGIACEISPDGSQWTLVHHIAHAQDPGDPVAVRLGRSSRSGGADDFPGAGTYGRSEVGGFRAFGDLTEEARALQAEQLTFLDDMTVSVHYEMYDGIPLLSKWVTVQNAGSQVIHLESFISEILAVVEYESVVDVRERWEYPNLHIETDYAFAGMDAQTANKTVNWVPDPQYDTQVNYLRRTPNLLEVRPPLGPDVHIQPGETFETFRTYTLVHDSTERTRKGLALRRMYRTIAPWTTENPLTMHVRSADPESVRLAIDQCAEVGFEMVIMTFWSGFDIENESPEYLQQIKELVDYANEKGIELGGYSLLASRSINAENDVINPKTGQPGGAVHGSAPCIGSEWGRDYFRKLYQFYQVTGLNLLEHDGSYAGDVCASCIHAGHRGLGDSQWTQWRTITDFYKWCRANGVSLNVPDYYFLSGSTKVGMGYRETNWSLPREQQVIHTRQNIFDGTWTKSASMGWMLVPLTEYHGGGPAATIEPLDQHRDHYQLIMQSNLGAGVQAFYRGPRLYDTDRTRDMVKGTVDWFKKYRGILESDIIHSSSRRADGRDIDWVLHANPSLESKGMLVVWNPLNEPVARTIPMSLYYTGLTDTARIREQEGQARVYELDRHYNVEIQVTVPANGCTWFVIE